MKCFGYGFLVCLRTVVAKGFKISWIPAYKQQTTENELSKTTNILNRTSKQLMQQAIQYNTDSHLKLQAQRETTWIQLKDTLTDTEMKMLKGSMDVIEKPACMNMIRLKQKKYRSLVDSHEEIESTQLSNEVMDKSRNYRERKVKKGFKQQTRITGKHL